MIRRVAVVVAAVAAVSVVGWRSGDSAVPVTPGTSVETIVGRGGVDIVRLLPGSHGGFEIRRSGVNVEAAPGAAVRGPIVILADDVTLRGVTVRGGETGISVRGAEGVVLDAVTVTGAEVHGIEVVDGQASVAGCSVSGLTDPRAQGIEIRNASSRGRSTVEGCRISGGWEGLVTHSARVEFSGNHVTGTSLRAIAITEMSEGIMSANRVTGVRGTALYCGDMSHCEVTANVVSGVTPERPGLQSQAGHGVVGWYYSTLRVHGNDFRVPGDPIHLTLGSVRTDRFPLSVWPPGWRGLVPGAAVAGLSLAGLVAVRAALTPVVRRLRRRAAADSPGARADGAATAVLVAGFLIQSFHMLEHVVQVVQVHVLDGEHRSGLAGAVVDTEWVHFIYNAAVLAFMVWLWRLIRPGSGDPLAVRLARWMPWVLTATLIQGYHMAEHAVKLAQHLATGIDPAPGLIGGHAGLVWFHFGINLAVYAGMALPAADLLISALRRRGTALRSPVPARG